jgi:pimeloyl-ACP methyl ester carboxylesterase
VLNLYGPSEDTTYSTWELVDPARGRAPLIGRPIAGTVAFVLDERGLPVPLGVPGELCLGGAGLARGYFDRPELTAERFVPDPLGGKPASGGRLYRTGDLARQLPDGRIDFLGRLDHQLKIRGFRIEPGEIESALLTHPAVRETAVLAREERPGDWQLAAFVSLREAGARPAFADELRDYLAARLPAHMVPAAIIALPALPLTPNGKVDRRALAHPPAAPEASAGGADGERAVPTGPCDAVELRLAAIWEDLLGVTPGARDSFFSLGGHSLLAVRLMSRIARDLGQQLPLSVLFQAPTLEGLAAVLRARGCTLASSGSPLVTLAAGGAGAPFFCVHPIGGSVFCYLDLARRLGGGRPFYALEARGLQAGEEPGGSVEEMAGRYLAAVRAVQPVGPYLLGGWSFGALVALEMARRLEEQGERVALLALFDPTDLSADGPAPPDDELALLRVLALDLDGLAGERRGATRHRPGAAAPPPPPVQGASRGRPQLPPASLSRPPRPVPAAACQAAARAGMGALCRRGGRCPQGGGRPLQHAARARGRGAGARAAGAAGGGRAPLISLCASRGALPGPSRGSLPSR